MTTYIKDSSGNLFNLSHAYSVKHESGRTERVVAHHDDFRTVLFVGRNAKECARYMENLEYELACNATQAIRVHLCLECMDTGETHYGERCGCEWTSENADGEGSTVDHDIVLERLKDMLAGHVAFTVEHCELRSATREETVSRQSLLAMCELLCNGLEHIDEFDAHAKQLNELDEAIYDMILDHHVRLFGADAGQIDYKSLIAAADTLWVARPEPLPLHAREAAVKLKEAIAETPELPKRDVKLDFVSAKPELTGQCDICGSTGSLTEGVDQLSNMRVAVCGLCKQFLAKEGE